MEINQIAYIRMPSFFAHILFSSLLPFTPLLLEFLLTQRVDNRSILIAVIMYVLAVALVSRNPLYFALGIFTAIIVLPVYGSVVTGAQNDNMPYLIAASIVAAIVMTISNITNGWQDYVIAKRRLFEW